MDRCQKFEWKKIRDQHPNMLECPTQGCDYLFFKESEAQTYHYCPICNTEYCLKCEIVYHVEQSCEEVQAEKLRKALEAKVDEINRSELPEDRMLEEWAGNVGAKRCTRCKFWVQKNEGCNHMTCRCGYEFCYVCGGVYQKCPCVQRQ